MTGKTHIAIGIASALTLSSEQPLENKLIIVLASILGSLSPDLDHPKAKLNQKLLKFKNNIFRMIFYLSLSFVSIHFYLDKSREIFLLSAFAFILVGISGHRGFTHSIIGFLTFTTIVKLVTKNIHLEVFYHGFSIGYFMHLMADFFNPRGIQIFYPVKTSISFPITIKTSSFFEDILFLLTSIYSMVIMLSVIKI